MDGGAGFLAGGGLNDVAALRKKIAELTNELKVYKSKGEPASPSDPTDKRASWLSSTGGGAAFGMDWPTTGSSQAKQLQDIQEELKIER